MLCCEIKSEKHTLSLRLKPLINTQAQNWITIFKIDNPQVKSYFTIQTKHTILWSSPLLHLIAISFLATSTSSYSSPSVWYIGKKGYIMPKFQPCSLLSSFSKTSIYSWTSPPHLKFSSLTSPLKASSTSLHLLIVCCQTWISTHKIH